MLGHYMGRVRNIIKIDVSFNGDATMDAISQIKIDCSSENIAETDSLVTPFGAPTEGDCIGDGIRSDGKDSRSTPSTHGHRWDAPPSGGATIGP